MRPLSLVPILLMLSLAHVAHAQDTAQAEVDVSGDADADGAQATLAENDALARDRFRSGTQHFDAGDYDLAVAEFESAYELSHRPELLYNVYLAHERLGNLTQAIRALEGYLTDGEPAERREALTSRLERLRQRLADDEAAAREREREQQEREQRLRDAAGPGATPWVIAGSGALVAAAGVVLLLVAQADIAAVENPGAMPMWVDVSGAYDRAPVLSTIGGIGLGVGGAALVTGLLWGLLTLDEGGTEAEVAIGPTGVMIRGKL